MSDALGHTMKRPARAAPVARHERLEVVDVLRGFAVLGVLIANMYDFSGQSYAPRELAGLDRFVVAAVRFLVEAKFYSLFSLLFGWGMAVQMLRAEARGTRFVPTFLRRLFVLLVFGTLHAVFLWSGDILATYALYGFLLLALRKAPKRALLFLVVLALLLPIVLVLPGEAMDSVRGWHDTLTSFMRLGISEESLYATGSYREITRLRIQETLSRHSYGLYTFGNIFGMFLLGLYIGRRRIFHDVQEHLPLVRKVLWIALPVGLACNSLYVSALLKPEGVPGGWYTLVTRGARTIGAPALMLFYAATIVLLAQKQSWRERLAPLASVGRMALTNYLLHSVICTLIFYGYGLGLYGEAGPIAGLGLSIVIYLGQIRFSSWWLERFQYGPMEWLWRVLTYGRVRPAAAAIGDEAPAEAEAPTHPAVAWGRTHGALITVWVVLLIWAGALGYWWTRLDRPGLAAPRAPQATAAARATARARTGTAVPARQPAATPVVQAVVRHPGPAVSAGDLWSVGLSFDEEIALGHIVELADPAYEGRRAGTEGGRAAADYIAERFAEYGLQPAGDDGGYFQEFPLDYFVALDGAPTLAVTGPDGATRQDYRFRQDFYILTGNYGGEGQAEGPVVWANTCSHDDFDDLNAVGKIVLCRAGGEGDYLRNGLEHRVAGLLMWLDPADRPFDLLGRYRESWVPMSYPAFAVTPQVVADLLEGSGLTLADLTLSFASRPLGTRVRLAASLETREGVSGRNVLGVLPGADPAQAGEVVIVGAHYDHVGRDPDSERCPPAGEPGSCVSVPGEFWPGANDDASGVAALLEVARSWNEAGYVPSRTVLFAAWDAEEQGLWGAIHYVTEPSYPLTRTVAMLQLDMVGGGGSLAIDGAGPLANRLSGLATSLGITSTVEDYGGSDHVPFRQSGVPASALAWQAAPDTTYHRPADLPATIQPANLVAAGRLASLALLDLSGVEPDIRRLVEEREAALVAGDRSRFLATSVAEQQPAEALWWDDVQAHGVQVVSLGVSDVVFASDVATGTLSLSYRPAESKGSLTLRGAVRFARTQTGWRTAGPAMTEMEGRRFAVTYTPGQEQRAEGLLQVAEALYPPLAAGLPAASGSERLRLALYGNADELRLAVSPALPQAAKAWVDGRGAALVWANNLTATQVFSATLTQLALAQTGLREEQAPWLWAGLPVVRATSADLAAAQRTRLPRLQTLLDDGLAIPVAEFPAARAVASPSDVTDWETQSWAMTRYLLQRYGDDAAGRLAAALGAGASLDAACQRVLSLSPQELDAAWQEDWRSRLAGSDEALHALLAARQDAVARGDTDAFLATVDPEDATLLEEERHWFEDLMLSPPRVFTLAGQLLALTDEGALARVTLVSQAGGGAEQRLVSEMALLRRGERWFSGGAPLQTVSSEHFVVRHSPALAALAERLVPVLEEIYVQETDDLQITPRERIVVKLYDQATAFRWSIALSLPNEVTQWARPGEAIKVLAPAGSDALALRSSLAYTFAQHVLRSMGLQVPWLREGIAQAEQARLAPQTGYLTARRMSRVQKAAAAGQLPPLAEWPAPDQVTSQEADLLNGATLDVVQYLERTHGRSAMNDLLQRLFLGDELQAASRAALGTDLTDFEAAWRESAARGHVPQQWVDDALAFDGEAALARVRQLAGEAYDGREAGTPGGQAATEYVAEQFAALGFQAAGDDGTFFQRFAFTRTLSTDLPTVRLRTDGGEALSELVYGRDFREVSIGAAGGGTVSERVVWVLDDDYTAMDLGGRIALRRVSGGDIRQEVQMALQHGAGGLLLATDVTEKELQRRVPLALGEVLTDTIPVLEMTAGSLETIVAEAGYRMADLNGSPPALLLDLWTDMVVPLAEPQATAAANVLALIPGSDAELTDELVILSAHLDHVGRSPDGTLYPGADDNASGVGVLLEVARLWREAGYWPSRSVLFAAWDAEELGQLGSSYYAGHPALPLDDTVGLLNLDGLGAGVGFFLTMQGDLTREALLRMHLDNAAALVGGRMDYSTEQEVGDHSPFRERGIPAALLTWDGSQDDANGPQDTPDRVDALKLTKTGRIVALALRTLAE